MGSMGKWVLLSAKAVMLTGCVGDSTTEDDADTTEEVESVEQVVEPEEELEEV